MVLKLPFRIDLRIKMEKYKEKEKIREKKEEGKPISNDQLSKTINLVTNQIEILEFKTNQNPFVVWFERKCIC